MSIKEKVGTGIAGMAYLAASLLGIIIHLWTVFLAFKISGIIATILTFIFPVLSEIYWFFKVGSNVGFGNIYCLSIMAYIGLLGIFFLGATFAGSGD